MHLTPEIDFIVVGQGIAGSCLAYELLERGARTIVYDDGWKSAACTVAAGVINPITGKRLVKSWRSAVAHPYARDFYRALERRIGGVFFHDRKILQLCKSAEEAELWRTRALDAEYAAFMSEPPKGESFGNLDDSFGAHFIGRPPQWRHSENILWSAGLCGQKRSTSQISTSGAIFTAG